MQAIVPTILAVLAFLLAWTLTLAVEARAGAAGLIQTPNVRSSHTVPTPSGGGIAIAVSSALAALVLAVYGANMSLFALAGLGSAAAALGFVDDLRDLSARIRFLVQALIVAGLIWMAWPVTPFALPLHGPAEAAVIGALLMFAGLWWINLFNFMDGIDGIAASQAIMILIPASMLWWLGAPGAEFEPLFWLMISVAAAAGGFLLRNWSPARIFMGDAGSNFLAVAIFGSALLTVGNGALSVQVWLILTAPFVSDATVTILRRVRRGEIPWRAHRRHAYQQISRIYGHRITSTAYGLISLCWASPLAAAARFFPDAGWVLALVCYLPLVAAAYAAGGGAATES